MCDNLMLTVDSNLMTCHTLCNSDTYRPALNPSST